MDHLASIPLGEGVIALPRATNCNKKAKCAIGGRPLAAPMANNTIQNPIVPPGSCAPNHSTGSRTRRLTCAPADRGSDAAIPSCRRAGWRAAPCHDGSSNSRPCSCAWLSLRAAPTEAQEAVGGVLEAVGRPISTRPADGRVDRHDETLSPPMRSGQLLSVTGALFGPATASELST